MGALVLPSAGSIYVDANCVIYSIERIEPYRALLESLWVSSEPRAIISSELTLLEVLVKPFKTGDAQLESLFRGLLLESSDVTLLPITQAVLERAALLRATTTLKTPDAIHAATALEHGCALFLTNDPAFRRAAGLPVTVLSDVLVP